MNRGRMLVLVGSFALIVGGFLPWISVPHLFGLSGVAYEGIEIGWEGDGILTAVIGLILLFGALLLGGASRRWFVLIGGVLAMLAALVALLDFRRIVEIAPAAGFYAATDIGLYVTLAGALLALIGCVCSYAPASKRQGAAAAGATAWYNRP